MSRHINIYKCRRTLFKFVSLQDGQATVEAAFLLPILFVVFGLLLQPVVLLYTRGVMNSAAAEGCRLSATATNNADVESFVRRRLGLVPNLSLFHNGGNASWKIECSCGKSDTYTVAISHEATVLPLLGISAGLVAKMQDASTVKQEVNISLPVHAAWYADEDKSASDWIKKWN